MRGPAGDTDDRMPTRTLGRTGVKVSAVGIGGHTIGRVPDRREAIRIVRSAVDEGINFIDCAWCYHGGESELRMGEALRNGYRDRVFLMTKNHGRDAATFIRQLEESLTRLETDCIDLLQFHNIAHKSDIDNIFNRGAIEAAMAARDEGKIRFIGFTGHHWPHLFRQMLDMDFPWDTVQLPLNLLDVHYRNFTNEILPLLVERNIGVIGMKVFSGGHIFETGVSAREAMAYSLSLPLSTLVIGIDTIDHLRENIENLKNWRPLMEEEKELLLEHVAPYARDGHLEKYKKDPE